MNKEEIYENKIRAIAEQIEALRLEMYPQISDNDYDKIRNELLQMEFMECNDEEDCKEIWIR